MTSPRDFKGIWIPKEIWLSKDLTVLEKVFLAEIDSLDGSDGCFASNEYFAEFFGLSKDRCKDVISSLKNKGRVDVILQNIGQNKDRRIIRGVWAKTPRPLGRKRLGGMGENALHITKHITKPIISNGEHEDQVYTDSNFISFWNVYPKKTGKGEAWRSWQKLKVSDTLAKRIIASVGDHAETRQWKEEEGRFIPNPGTYLNQRRFDDEVKPAPKKVTNKYALLDKQTA